MIVKETNDLKLAKIILKAIQASKPTLCHRESDLDSFSRTGGDGKCPPKMALFSPQQKPSSLDTESTSNTRCLHLVFA